MSVPTYKGQIQNKIEECLKINSMPSMEDAKTNWTKSVFISLQFSKETREQDLWKERISRRVNAICSLVWQENNAAVEGHDE